MVLSTSTGAGVSTSKVAHSSRLASWCYLLVEDFPQGCLSSQCGVFGVSPELVTEHVQRNSLVLSCIVKGDDAGLEDRVRTQGDIFSFYYEENLG